MSYKFKAWHLVIAIVAVFLLNSQYHFLGSIISADGFSLYGDSTIDFTNEVCWQSGDLNDNAYTVDKRTFCHSDYWTKFIYTKLSWSGAGTTGTNTMSINGSDSSVRIEAGGKPSTPSSYAVTKEDFSTRSFRTDVRLYKKTDKVATVYVSMVPNIYYKWINQAFYNMNITESKLVYDCKSKSAADGCPYCSDSLNYGCQVTFKDAYVDGNGCQVWQATRIVYDSTPTPVISTCGGTKGSHLVNTSNLPSANTDRVELLSIKVDGSGGTKIGLVEIKPSFLNTGEVGVWWQGQFVNTVDVSSIPVGQRHIMLEFKSDGGDVTFSNIRYQYQFSCDLGPNDLLAMETFTGGQLVSVTSLRFPFKSFCLAHPVIVTSPEGSTATAEPYAELVQGKSLTIPSDQTWTIFYVFDNSAGLVPTTCSVEEAYNINTGACQEFGGVVQVCSSGVWDPTAGICVISSSVICPEDYSFNIQTSMCEKPRDTLPVTCPTDYVYSSSSKMCEKDGNLVEPSCAEGYDFIAAQDVCGKDVISVDPDYEPLCPSGRFDITTNTCIYNPPVQRVCKSGTWDEVVGACVLVYGINSTCPANMTWDPTNQVCIGLSPVIGDRPVIDLRNIIDYIDHPIQDAKDGNFWPLIVIVLLLLLVIAILSRTQKGKVIIKKVFKRRKRR